MTAANTPEVNDLAAYRAPWYIHALCFGLTLTFTVMIAVRGAQGGHGTVCLMGMIVALGLMGWTRKYMESESELKMFDSKTGSWAFLLGYPALAFALGLSGLAHDEVHVGTGFLGSRLWLLISIAVGLVIAWYFRNKMDKPMYDQIAEGEALRQSPTKLVHDKVVVPTLFGSLVFLTVPLLLQGSWLSPLPYLVTVLLGAWLACGLRDGRVGLDPRLLHSKHVWRTNRAIDVR